jgi:hypothetical protein
MIWLRPHPLHPPPPSVSSTCDTQEDWERETTCWWERGEGRSQIIWRRISLVLYNSFNTLCCRCSASKMRKGLRWSSVADPLHFGVDPDPDMDPRIHAWILLFSSLTFPRCQQKTNLLKSFFAFTFWRYMYIIYKDKKSIRSHKAVGIKVFLTFCLLGDRRILIRIHTVPLTDGSGSGSRRPKNMWIRWIWIRNTAFMVCRTALKIL